MATTTASSGVALGLPAGLLLGGWVASEAAAAGFSAGATGGWLGAGVTSLMGVPALVAPALAGAFSAVGSLGVGAGVEFTLPL